MCGTGWHHLGKKVYFLGREGGIPAEVRAGLQVYSQLNCSAAASATGRKAYANSGTLLRIFFLPT